MKPACLLWQRIVKASVVVGVLMVGGCEPPPSAIVEATDQTVVIREQEKADHAIMQEKADQVCGVSQKKAVYVGSTCSGIFCLSYKYKYECR